MSERKTTKQDTAAGKSSATLANGVGSAGKGKGGKKSSPANNAAAADLVSPDGEDKTTAVLKQMMSEHSSKAQSMRQNINERLELLEQSLQASNEASSAGDGQPANILSETNQQIKQLLEKTIKEKLADLEEALRGKQPEDPALHESIDKLSVKENDSGKRTPKERSPDLVKVAIEEKSPPKVTAAAAASEKQSNGQPLVNTADPNDKKSQKNRKTNREKVTVENVLKSLSSCPTDSDKLMLLTKKYIDLLDENRGLEQQNKQQEKISAQLLKEREQLQSEHNRVVLAKSRLENLCRELQRQNKAVKEESLSKIKEEEEKRRDIACKFQSTFNEIMQLVNDNQKRNELLKEENQELAQKLKALMNHYDNWEKNIEKIIQQKDLESQLMKAKLAKTNLLLNAEKEQFLQEKKTLMQMVMELQQRTTELTATELQLRAELKLYTTKYDEFQSTLSKSNDTFAMFKKDMEKMSKQIKKLEKETLQWKGKWEQSNKSLITATEERNKCEEELLAALQKVQKLEKLCRALQEERTKMQSQLKVQSSAEATEITQVTQSP